MHSRRKKEKNPPYRRSIETKAELKITPLRMLQSCIANSRGHGEGSSPNPAVRPMLKQKDVEKLPLAVGQATQQALTP